MMSNRKYQSRFTHMRTLSLGISFLLILNGCVSISEKKTSSRFQNTDVSFSTGNKALQELFDSAEKKAKKNIIQYNNEYKVMVEGAVYPFVFLETQPMAGGMYAKRDLEIAYNNISIFLKNQREDGRLAGLIVNMDNDIWGMRENMTIVDEGSLGLFFGTLQGLYLSEAAFELSFFLGDYREDFLELVKSGLKKYDAYLWKYRDSDGDGCLESWAMTDTGEDHMKRLHYAPWVWPYDYPPSKETIPIDDAEFMEHKFGLTGLETFTIDKMRSFSICLRRKNPGVDAKESAERYCRNQKYSPRESGTLQLLPLSNEAERENVWFGPSR